MAGGPGGLDPAEAGGEVEEDGEEEAAQQRSLDRDRDLLGRRGSSPIRKKLADLYGDIHRGFTDQVERTDDQMDWWDCYFCHLNEKQYYNGQSQIYVPIVRDAINARATRFVNQLFPRAGHYVDVTSTDGTVPFGIIGLLDHYIRATKLKTQIARSLCINGDIEGQYNLYVDWHTDERQIVSRETHGPEVEGAELEGDEIEDITVEDVTEGRPGVEVIHDSDVLVLPPSAASVEDALQQGGCVVIVRRWTKAKLSQMAAEGLIRKSEADDLKAMMDAGEDTDNVSRDAGKVLREHCGIKQKGRTCVVWEVWKNWPLSDDGDYSEKGTERLCRGYMGCWGQGQLQLGLKRNPYWNDRCSLLSWPVVKQTGVFKGQSLVEPIASLQYEANDAANEGADAATYAAAPIVKRDPTNTTANLIFNMGAIWDIAPKDAEIIAFPDLTPRAMTRIQYAQQAIFQALGVNPSMLPQQSGRSGQKRNQAEVAMEQQVDLLTTAEAVSTLEENGLTELMRWFVDLDHQFRETEITVRAYGQMGMRAERESLGPIQNSTHFTFLWSGVEQAKNAAQVQQQIGGLNVLRGMEQPLKAAGYRLNIAPVVESLMQSLFDARIAPLVLIDEREELTVPPAIENALMEEGHTLNPHPMDNGPQHIQSHQEDMQLRGDPYQTKIVHMQKHIQLMQLQAAAMMQQQLQRNAGKGNPGVPGQPGVAGTPRGGQPPRIGANPRGPQLVKGPPGQIPPDQMGRAGAVIPPRRA